MDVDAVFRKLEWSQKLPEGEKIQLKELLTHDRVIARHKDMISFGADPRHVFVMLDGWAARYRTLRDGSRRILSFLLPGDFCNLQSIAIHTMDHGIKTVSECHVAYVEREEVDRIVRSNSVASRALLRSTLIDEAILRRWLGNSGRLDAYEAIAHLFCELHCRLELVGLAEGSSIFMPARQEEIGDAVGITSVHVNRTLNRMRADGLIEYRKGRLTINDLAALRRVGSFSTDYMHLGRTEQS